MDDLIRRGAEGEDMRDLTKGADLATLAVLMQEAGKHLDELGEKKSAMQRVYDQLRLACIPELMTEQQLKSANVDGVGRVTLTAGVYTSVPSGQQQALHEWLVENGYEDLIKESVNSSTLNAWVSRRLKAGEEVPDVVKITPFTRASITPVK